MVGAAPLGGSGVPEGVPEECEKRCYLLTSPPPLRPAFPSRAARLRTTPSTPNATTAPASASAHAPPSSTASAPSSALRKRNYHTGCLHSATSS